MYGNCWNYLYSVSSAKYQINEKVKKSDKFFADVSLQHDTMPSQLAAICLACARHLRGIKPIWTPNLSVLTKYNFENNSDEIIKKVLSISIKTNEQLKAELEENYIFFRTITIEL